MPHLLQSVFPNKQNSLDIYFKHIKVDGSLEALDLRGVTRAVVTLVGALSGADVVLDSDTGADIYTDETGLFEMRFYGETIDVGEFNAIIDFYDIQHTNGQTVVHPDSRNRLTVRVLDGS